MLESLFQELNQQHFQRELPLPELEWNSRLSSSAGRFCPGSRNLLFPRAPKIEIATYLRKIPESDFHIRDTMLHEMVHYILWHRRRPYGHTPEFHQILKKVGARRYNPVPNLKPIKHWYTCPNCRVVIPARRQIKDSACLACCKKFNFGKYSAQFRLMPTMAPANPSPAQIKEAEKEELPVLEPQEIIDRLEALKKMLTRA